MYHTSFPRRERPLLRHAKCAEPNTPVTARHPKVPPSRRRQHGHDIDLVNRLLVGQRADLDHGRGRHARRIEIFEPYIAHHAEVRLQVDEIMAELYDVLEAAAGRAKRALDVE